MGSVGDAYDNALCESFFATFECELLDRRRHSALDYLSPLAYEQRELAPVCAGRGKPSTKPGQVHSRLRASCSALPEAPPSRDATADVCPHRPWPERSRTAHRLVPGVITSRHPIDRAPGSALLPSLPTRAANYDGALAKSRVPYLGRTEVDASKSYRSRT